MLLLFFMNNLLGSMMDVNPMLAYLGKYIDKYEKKGQVGKK